ncbi:MAG: succinate dehydrogenase assembly factor 2 family protein [Gammaproteobacteria bacterium]|jgi:antitoxin CptB|nr:succinate dehydrogenase assembly factor 2 family protein [Gammaproteobacteria bacterium]
MKDPTDLPVLDNLDPPERVRWHCRRGMLELDLILIPFFDKQYHILDSPQKQVFQTLLTYPDPDLFACLMGQQEPNEPALKEIIKLIRHANASSARS